MGHIFSGDEGDHQQMYASHDPSSTSPSIMAAASRALTVLIMASTIMAATLHSFRFSFLFRFRHIAMVQGEAGLNTLLRSSINRSSQLYDVAKASNDQFESSQFNDKMLVGR